MHSPRAIPAFLHIGEGKCGSSSLQRFFSFHPRLKLRTGGTLHYIAIDRTGHLACGHELTERAAVRTHQYLCCMEARHLRVLDSSALLSARSALEEVVRDGDAVLLSNETWHSCGDVLAGSGFLECLGLDARSIYVVRPQPAYLNSFWWQTGAWMGVEPHQWLQQAAGTLDWSARLGRFESASGVPTHSVQLLEKGLVGKFLDALGALPPGGFEEVTTNRSLPSTVLRTFQARSFLRPEPEYSEIDFAIERHLSNEKDPVPWVIDHELIAALVDRMRAGNTALANRLLPDQRERMLADPRWWDAAAYAHLKTTPPGPAAIDPELALDSLANAMHAIFDLETGRIPPVISGASAGGVGEGWTALELERLRKEHKRIVRAAMDQITHLKTALQSAIERQSGPWWSRAFRRWRTTPDQRYFLRKPFPPEKK